MLPVLPTYLQQNVKVYSRHSGGIVTYDLVNEVLKDADVPPMLGAMDSDWDCIDYDGSYFFHSDKIFELRDEFQKEISLSLPNDADFNCICPIDDKNTEHMKQYVQSLVTGKSSLVSKSNKASNSFVIPPASAAIYGEAKARNVAVSEAFQSPFMGACYRVIVSKMLQMLAFKQHDQVSQRCWRLLRACNYNAQANHISCRPEYFHLAEVLISQLMAPYETIKVPETQSSQVKMELEEEQTVLPNTGQQQYSTQASELEQQQPQPQAPQAAPEIPFSGNAAHEETIYKLEDDSNDEVQQEPQQLSSYFATPVGNSYVDELCETIGQMAAQSGYLQAECLFLIKRRLDRFFEGREVCSERGKGLVLNVILRCH